MQKLASEIFKGCASAEQVTIPASVMELQGESFDGCPGLTAIYVEDGSGSYSSENGVLFNKTKTELIRCPEGKSGEYTVPYGVVLIKNAAFRDCMKLTGVTVQEGVTKIGSGFYGKSDLWDV